MLGALLGACSLRDLSGLNSSEGEAGSGGSQAIAGASGSDGTQPAAGTAGTAGASGGGGSSGNSEGGTRADAGAAGAEPVITVTPKHRYTFDGKGPTAVDSIGTADGTLSGGARLDGKGQLELDGISGVVQFPAKILSSLPETTLMLWVSWSSNVDGFGVTLLSFGSPTSFVELMTRDAPEGCANVLLGGVTTQLGCGGDLAHDEWVQISLTLPASGQLAKVYRDGKKLSELALDQPLSNLDDANAWLGRHQTLSGHARFCGSIREMRIYDRALSECEVEAAATAGSESLAFSCAASAE